MFGDILRPATAEELAAGQPAPTDRGTPPDAVDANGHPILTYHRMPELPPIGHDGGGGLRYYRMVPNLGDLTDGPAPTPSEGEHPLRYPGLHRRYNR